MSESTEFAVDERAHTVLGERTLSLTSAGRDPTALLRLEVDDTSIELRRQDWTYVFRLLGGMLAPLPELPAERKIRTGPARRGKPWKEDEDSRLRAAWLDGTPLEDLADEHERTQGAVAARLVRLELVADRDQARLQSRSGERGVSSGQAAQAPP